MNHPQKIGRWFDVGIERAKAAHVGWRQTRADIFSAGLCFINARAEMRDGDWGDYLESRRDRISPRSVYRYIQFAEESLAWAKEFAPKLVGVQLENYAREHVSLQSPRALVALLRTLRKPNAPAEAENAYELLPFGLYDEVKHKLNRSPRQVEFNFVSVSSQIDLLTHLDEPNYTWKLPAGKTERAALGELKGQLETVLAKIDAKLTETTIET